MTSEYHHQLWHEHIHGSSLNCLKPAVLLMFDINLFKTYKLSSQVVCRLRSDGAGKKMCNRYLPL